MLFLSKNKFSFALVCNIVYAGQLFMTKSDIIPRRWRHANIFWHRWSSLLNGLPHRLTTPCPSLATTPAYNKEDNLPVRTGLQRPRPVHLSVPPQMLRSYLPSVSRGLVYINTPGRTCLHELFIEYEQVTAWEAGFLPTNWRQIIMYYQPPSALDGSMDMRTSHRHYSLVNFKQPVGKNHWPVADMAHMGSFINPP